MRKIITLTVLLLIVNGLNAQYSKDTLIQSVTQSCFLVKRNFTALDLINREAHNIPLSDLKKRKTVTVHRSICLPYILSPALLRIRDGQDDSALPGATVTFISSDRRDTLMYVADSAGQVNRKDLKKDVSYTISVTATGYKAFTGSVSDLKNEEVRLERDFILGPDVIVSSGHVCICRRLYVYQEQQVSHGCGMQVKLIIEQTTEKTSKLLEKRELSVYPNPVQRGQLVSLKLLQGYFPAGTVRVLTLDGKQLFSMAVNGNQQQGLIRLPTQQGWASGLYIFQLVYANGRVGASEKVILQ